MTNSRHNVVPDYIGIIGTPIIDATTNTAYFFSKGYKNSATGGGVANGNKYSYLYSNRTDHHSGIYRFYAVDILTLEDKPGFPVLINGNFADNDPTR